jgi:hypothetical protein
MSKYYSEDPEYSQISFSEKTIRDKLEAILESYSRNLNYSYSCSDEYGVPEDRFDDVAEKIMDVFNMWDDDK